MNVLAMCRYCFIQYSTEYQAHDGLLTCVGVTEEGRSKDAGVQPAF